MRDYPYSADYDDPLLAELYDQHETDTDDVALIRRLIGDAGPLRVLEAFCGTGRILAPLVQDGHHVTGLEIAPEMLARAAQKVAALGVEAEARTTLRAQDVLAGPWGEGFDLVIVAGNSLYELPSAEAQARCLGFAAAALAPGGHLYLDNDDYKGDWGDAPRGVRVIFDGYGADGAHGRWLLESLSFDEDRAVLQMRRTWQVRAPDGTERTQSYTGRKHPVGQREVRGWLEGLGLRILQVYGDWLATPYTPESARAIFWARRA